MSASSAGPTARNSEVVLPLRGDAYSRDRELAGKGTTHEVDRVDERRVDCVAYRSLRRKVGRSIRAEIIHISGGTLRIRLGDCIPAFDAGEGRDPR